MALFTFIINDSDFNKKELKRLNIKLDRIERKLNILILDKIDKEELDEVYDKIVDLTEQVKNIV